MWAVWKKGLWGQHRFSAMWADRENVGRVEEGIVGPA